MYFQWATALRKRTGKGLTPRNYVLIPSAFPVTATAAAVTFLPRRAPPAIDCLAQPCRDARGHWRRATGTWPIVCGMWHTAGPAPAPAGSHSTHTGSQLCRPLTSGTTKSHLLAWRMPMVASCSTEQLPLSSYSMFNIWCGKENEFFLPI